MNTALFPFPAVLAPLHSLWRKLAPAQQMDRTIPSIPPASIEASAILPIACGIPLPISAEPQHGRTMATHPLRVVHVVEAGMARTQIRRMRISGRMADVCAELDRLADREAMLH